MNSYGIMAIFTSISISLVVLLLIIFKKYLKKQSTIDLVYVFFTILTVILHFSIIPYNAIMGKEIYIEDNMYLPVYPCNVMMWLSLINAFLKKDGKVSNTISDFLFYCGTLCAFFGLILNYNFYENPNLKDYGVLKGLLSHVSLLFTTLYLKVMGYIKIDTKRNIISAIIGIAIFIISGLITNVVKKIQNVAPTDGMLLKIDIHKPFYNLYVISIIGLIIIFVFTKMYKKIKEQEKK